VNRSTIAKDAELANLKAENARLREAGRWVAVGESLPEFDYWVLTTDGKNQAIQLFHPRYSGWVDGDLNHSNVTHWMLLPTLPEAQP
jgi:hypothetical protein